MPCLSNEVDYALGRKPPYNDRSWVMSNDQEASKCSSKHVDEIMI